MMKNWSQNQHWKPSEFCKPSSENEIKLLIDRAINLKKNVRVFGTKHSFTSINNTNDFCLNLDNYQGIINVDTSTNYVTVKSGTKLHLLTKLLSNHNLAMENMGDIDQQSIAGAIGTGTHGTGIKFGNISTQVVGVKFINGVGEEVYCSNSVNPSLFKCLQVSLGAFGIITEITLRCIPEYKLHLKKKAEDLEDILISLDKINQKNRNFEFYWLPYTNKVQTKYSNITYTKNDKDNFLNYFNDVILENYIFKSFCEVAKFFSSLNCLVSQLTSKFLSDSSKVKFCRDIYATPRYVKFNEMEYNIPIEAYKDCVNDIVKLINSKKFNIHFPLENRFVASDDIYLSPSYKRESAYIACHIYKGKPYEAYFKALEEIFLKYEGRPHWGKIHFKKSDYFSSVYPEFNTFNKLRAQHDPYGIFVNDYLKRVLL